MASRRTPKGISSSGVSHEETASSMTSINTTFTKDAVERVSLVNKRLLSEIDNLKLKMEVEMKEQECNTSRLVNASEQRMKTRELEIVHLQTELKKKEDKIKDATQEHLDKQKKLDELQQYIHQLNHDVTASKDYAEQIQSQLDSISVEQSRNDKKGECELKDKGIESMKTELICLWTNLTTLEDEISKSKLTMLQQGYTLSRLENDRTNMQLHFKEQLAEISRTMKQEVDMMRNAIIRQSEDIRALREANNSVNTDIQAIKDLLISQSRPKPKSQQQHSPQHQQHYQHQQTQVFALSGSKQNLNQKQWQRKK